MSFFKKFLCLTIAAAVLVAVQAPALSAQTELPKGKWVIGLSNSYYGNTWRKQMVDSFTEAATEAKKNGYIKDFIVQNGDGTVNAQIAQINSFILKGVDAICINAASPTALNNAIKKALDAGIVVIAFDSIVDINGAYTMDYDWIKTNEMKTQYIADRLGNKGNVIVLRGVSGSAPDAGMYEGTMNIINKYDGLVKVAEVLGEASATKAQEAILKILPSLPEVDAVVTQGGGEAIGVVQAFEQSGRKMPIVIGDNTAEFIRWWSAAKAKDGYATISSAAPPSCSSAALWTAINILNGMKVPQNMMLAFSVVDQDTVDQYKDIPAGTMVAPTFTNEFVVKNILEPARKEAGME